jgi:type II secretory pathway pseudopilin PulG
MKKKSNIFGFSMIELMIIISIISILAVTTTTQFERFIKTKKEDAQDSNVKTLNSAIVKYRQQRGYFPSNLKDLVDAGIIDEIPMNFRDEKNRQLWELMIKGGGSKKSNDEGMQSILKVIDEDAEFADKLFITAGYDKEVVIGEIVPLIPISIPSSYKDLLWSGEGVLSTKVKDKNSEFYQNKIGEFEIKLTVVDNNSNKAEDSFFITVKDFNSMLYKEPFTKNDGFLSGEVLITNKKEFKIKGTCSDKTDRIIVKVNDKEENASIVNGIWSYTFKNLVNGEYNVELLAYKFDQKIVTKKYEDKNNIIKFKFLINLDIPIIEINYIADAISNKITIWADVLEEFRENENVYLNLNQPGEADILSANMAYLLQTGVTKLTRPCYFYETNLYPENEPSTNEFKDGLYEFDLKNLKLTDKAGNKLQVINKNIKVKTLPVNEFIVNYDGPSKDLKSEEIFYTSKTIILENDKISWTNK